ncbi:MAG: hypothetical protein AB8B85_12570 [Paracoccaceae bacterium]
MQQAIRPGHVVPMDFDVPSADALPRSNSGVIAQFYSDSVIDGPASVEAGRLVYKNEEFVTITVPGEAGTNVTQKVTDRHRQMYPDQYAHFQRGAAEDFVEGTPLAEWPLIGRAMVMNLKVMNVYSVEQLAAMSDSNLMSVGMGGTQLRQKAIEWLGMASDSAAPMRVASENTALLQEVANLRAQLTTLQQQSDQMAAVNRTVMMNAGTHAPNDDQLGQISMMGQHGTAPNPDLARQMAEANGLEYQAAPSMPGRQPAIPPVAPPVAAEVPMPDLPILAANEAALEPVEE